MFLYDLAAGTAVNLTPHSGDQTFYAAAFSPDGKSLLVTSNAGEGAAHGYDNVALLDIASKKLTWITADQWEIRANSFSPDGQSVVWSANVDGREALYSRAVAGGEIQRLPVAEGVNDFAGAGAVEPRRTDACSTTTAVPRKPNDLYVYDCKTKSDAADQFVCGGFSSAGMVTPALVHYPSQDGKFTISAWAYVPNNIIRNQSIRRLFTSTAVLHRSRWTRLTGSSNT